MRDQPGAVDASAAQRRPDPHVDVAVVGQGAADIASNILADRLKRLTRDGLLTRDGAGPGQKATYSLTEQAIELVPVLAQLGAWGRRHRPTTPSLRVRAELLESGGPQMWNDYMDELRETHLGIPRPTGHPSVSERLSHAYAEASRS